LVLFCWIVLSTRILRLCVFATTTQKQIRAF